VHLKADYRSQLSLAHNAEVKNDMPEQVCSSQLGYTHTHTERFHKSNNRKWL